MKRPRVLFSDYTATGRDSNGRRPGRGCGPAGIRGEQGADSAAEQGSGRRRTGGGPGPASHREQAGFAPRAGRPHTGSGPASHREHAGLTCCPRGLPCRRAAPRVQNIATGDGRPHLQARITACETCSGFGFHPRDQRSIVVSPAAMWPNARPQGRPSIARSNDRPRLRPRIPARETKSGVRSRP